MRSAHCSSNLIAASNCLQICFFFFNDTATTEIYTLSLHDALPIYLPGGSGERRYRPRHLPWGGRSEEHTSELQSQSNLVCRLLLEKKKRRGSGSLRSCLAYCAG